MAYSYFERLVFLFFNVLTLLVVIFNVVSVFLMMVVFIHTLGNSILRRVILFFRSSVDDRYVSCNVIDVYYLYFLIGVIFDEMALLSVL